MEVLPGAGGGVVGAGRVGSRAPRGVVVVTHLRTLVSGIGWRQWGWENSEWMWKMESAKPSEQLSVGVRAKGCGSAWPLGGYSPGCRKARTT